MIDKFRVAVVTISDKGSAGQRQDESGPLISQIMREWGLADVDETIIIPDDFELIKNTLVGLCDDKKYDLILTTGGTGLAERDVTPEATLAMADRNVPEDLTYGVYRSRKAYYLYQRIKRLLQLRPNRIRL